MQSFEGLWDNTTEAVFLTGEKMGGELEWCRERDEKGSEQLLCNITDAGEIDIPKEPHTRYCNLLSSLRAQYLALMGPREHEKAATDL